MMRSKGSPSNVIQTAPFDRSVRRGERGEFIGLRRGAVGDQQPSEPGLQQGRQYSPRGPARAQQQHPRALEAKAVVVAQIPDQADPIGIVPAQPAIRQPDQGIDRARQFGPRAAFIRQRPGLLLERDGNVETQAAGGEKTAGVTREVGEVPEDSPILQTLSGLAREGRVDQRGFAVGDGVADDGVTIGHDQSRDRRHVGRLS